MTRFSIIQTQFTYGEQKINVEYLKYMPRAQLLVTRTLSNEGKWASTRFPDTVDRIKFDLACSSKTALKNGIEQA